MESLKQSVTNKIITQSEIKCKHCGKPYKHILITSKNAIIPITDKVFDEPDCNCNELIAQKKLEEEMQKKEQELKNIQAELQEEKQKRLFTNSMMTPLFKDKKFENLNKTDAVIKCMQYAQQFNKDTSKGIQMIGNVGTGKTTLLASICNYLLEKGQPCLFTTFSNLLDELSSYSFQNAGDITGKLNDLTRFDFVVLDDIGRENYTDKRKETAFRVIDTLMNYKVVTAFTANPEMIERLKNMPESRAMIDRLKDMCPIKFEFRGESLRGKKE